MKNLLLTDTVDPLPVELLDIFLEFFTGLLEGIGGGAITLFQTLVYDPESGLTTLAIWAIVFMAFSIAMGIFSALWNRLT